MANHNWTGSAPIRTQQESHVLASTAIADVITATISNVTVVYTAASTDDTAEALALSTLLTASDLKEFEELTFTPTGATIGIVGDSAGVPFTITIVNAGTGTVTPTTDQASMSPNHWAADNFDSGALPANTDSVYVNVNVAIKYLLGQSAVDLTLLQFGDDFSSAGVGLPDISTSGYYEYKTKYLEIGATRMVIGTTTDASLSGTFRIQAGTDSTTFIAQSGTIDLLATHVATTVDAAGDSVVNIASSPLDTSTIATLHASANATANIGTGVTVALVQTQNSAIVELDSNPTTLNKEGSGSMIVRGPEVITTLEVVLGTLDFRGVADVTTLTVLDSGIFTMVNSVNTADIQTININRGGVFRDPYGRRDAGSTGFNIIAGSLDQVTIETPQTVAITVIY